MKYSFILLLLISSLSYSQNQGLKDRGLGSGRLEFLGVSVNHGGGVIVKPVDLDVTMGMFGNKPIMNWSTKISLASSLKGQEGFSTNAGSYSKIETHVGFGYPIYDHGKNLIGLLVNIGMDGMKDPEVDLYGVDENSATVGPKLLVSLDDNRISFSASYNWLLSQQGVRMQVLKGRSDVTLSKKWLVQGDFERVRAHNIQGADTSFYNRLELSFSAFYHINSEFMNIEAGPQVKAYSRKADEILGDTGYFIGTAIRVNLAR